MAATPPPEEATAPVDPPAEEQKRPNVHLRRLGAIGNFLIGRHHRRSVSSDGAAKLAPKSENGAVSRKRGGSEPHVSPIGKQAPSPSRRTRSNVDAFASDGQALGGRRLHLTIIENFVQEAAASPVSPPRTPPRAAPPASDSAVASRSTPRRRSRASSAAVPEEIDVTAMLQPAGGVVVDEVFENERWQPIWGWGHSWPGHFLPTDPCRRWCRRGAETPWRAEGVNHIDELPAPDGWVWCAFHVLALVHCQPCGVRRGWEEVKVSLCDAWLCCNDRTVDEAIVCEVMQVLPLADRPIRHRSRDARQGWLVLCRRLPHAALLWGHTGLSQWHDMGASPALGTNASASRVARSQRHSAAGALRRSAPSRNGAGRTPRHPPSAGRAACGRQLYGCERGGHRAGCAGDLGGQ